MTFLARPAQPRDIDLLFAWANDPLTRQNSFSSQPIPWEDHKRWFFSIITGEGARLFIIEKNGVAVGSYRVDADGEVGFTLGPEFRGRGLGLPLFRAGTDAAAKHFPGLVAYVKVDNVASKKIIERVFTPLATVRHRGQRCYLLTYGQVTMRARLVA